MFENPSGARASTRSITPSEPPWRFAWTTAVVAGGDVPAS